MTSKKTAKSKRAVLPRSSDYTKEFLADWQRLSRSGRYDMVKLKEVMMLLIANDEPLGVVSENGKNSTLRRATAFT